MTKDHLAVSGHQGQRILRLYHLYRLLIGFALVLLISSNLDGHLLDITHAQLFHYSSWTYLIVNIIATASMHRTDRLLPIFALALFDVTQLSLLFYAAGGTIQWHWQPYNCRCCGGQYSTARPHWPLIAAWLPQASFI